MSLLSFKLIYPVTQISGVFKFKQLCGVLHLDGELLDKRLLFCGGHLLLFLL